MPYGFNEDKSKYDMTATKTPSVLVASNWSGSTYSFESTYPSAEYDIDIEPNGDTVTSTHLDQWGAARLVGSPTSNILKAVGTVPTIDIPIVIKVVNK